MALPSVDRGGTVRILAFSQRFNSFNRGTALYVYAYLFLLALAYRFHIRDAEISEHL